MTGTRDDDLDDGFGLIEVVVAMLLFAVIAMAILPLAIQATTLSAGNREAVAANAAASAELAALRTDFPDGGANSCGSLSEATPTGELAEPLAATITVEPCPADFPAALTVTVDVRDTAASDPTAVLVTMATKIVVTAP
ncbi:MULTISPECIES: type IV pilus modification PilV family protein [Microbacterium]|jgi:prepilin-type N-terminal cleavage/methylation domain-containing protein|uniref:type IV pilus modification PilV family protein n=1 Tax=Microbacterium TaxID=33882 RepID=UPI001D17775B|nr:prepilin-type N-terminal cleavage/methylation domain-containing protein [Microbacterium testaceum]MCC4249600.1 prepilin-type N-terminal cleavage/methylation domain-containing protein [Microbacterium testaceum]